MALPKDYADQSCSLARSLEVVGERWTLLIVRDAFYGVRRFRDFAEHLGIPRAVLSDRLKHLVEDGVLAKSPVEGERHDEYLLTEKGRELWPIVYALTCWGDRHFSRRGNPREFVHSADGGRLAPDLTCEACGRHVELTDTDAIPGPGLRKRDRTGVVGEALRDPHRLLEPIAPVTSP